MLIVWYPCEFSRLYNLRTWFWKSLLYSLISSGENSAHYLQLKSLISLWVQQTLQFTPLVLELSPLWSHLLWGGFSAFSAANAIHNFPIFRSTRYPSLLGGQRQYGMRSLHDTSTHDQQWESNPRLSDLRVQRPMHLATCSHALFNH